MSFVDFCTFQEAHERAQDTTKDIEPSDTCGEPLLNPSGTYESAKLAVPVSVDSTMIGIDM